MATSERRGGERPVRAVGLLSGGLDSMLAVRLLQALGVEVLGLSFRSCFFDTAQAEAAARQLGIPLQVIDVTEEHLRLVRQPPHGYGKCMNPCIDCHTLMLKHAGRLMEEKGYDFVFTGEVLGERPMSQNRQALKLVAEESGYADRILRPLSAKLLSPTRPEQEGLVDREQLLDIRGRSRKRQMELARSWCLIDYPTPAGGCRLTDPNFSKRLRDLLDQPVDVTPRDVELLKLGRHFRLSDRVKVVMGRNQQENERLLALQEPTDTHLVVIGPPGPDVLIPAGEAMATEHVELAARLTVSYADVPEEEIATVRVTSKGKSRDLTVGAIPRKDAHKLLV